ncbi:MAG: PAS domain S-box protein [Lysobacterales bacterium]
MAGIVALVGIDRYYRAEVALESERRLAELQADRHGRLAEKMGDFILLAEHLKAFLLANSEIPDREAFNRYAHALMLQSPEARALQYTDPDHVIRYIFPLEGNEQALGLNLMSRPAASIVDRTIRTRQTQVGEPVTTVQGSLSIVIRAPMFAGERYLGLAGVVVDIGPLLEGVFGGLAPNYGLQLKDRDGRILWSNGTETETATESAFPVDNGAWSLFFGPAVPERGPRIDLLALIWGLGTALLVSVLVSINLLFRRMQGLSAAVTVRTAALAESEVRYRTLVETTDDAIVLADLDYNMLFANRAFYRSLGFEGPGDAEFDAFARLHPEDKPEILAKMATLHEKGTITAEYRVRHKDGHWVNRRARINLLRDERGEPQSLMLIAHDITDRLRDEKELADTRDLLQSVFASLGAAILVVDSSTRKIVLCNPAVEDVFGYTPEELTGRSTEILYPDQAAYERFATLGEPALAERGHFRTEFEMRRRDGETVYTENTVLNLAEKEHWDSQLVVSVVRDITDQKLLQAERNALEGQYLRAQKMEAVGQLTAGIAHDFNNLLMAITGNAQMMQMTLSEDDPLYAQTESILEAGLRAAELIRQLLVFSRKDVVRPQVVDFNDIIGKTGEMLKRVIGEDIEFVLDLASGLWTVRADPGQLDQVVVNLAVNARDAMPKGGRLTVTTLNVVLDEAFVERRLEQQPGEYVLLRVSDTGMGMSEEVQSRIFEPFFTTKEPGRGTGLGLATVYGIVQRSGGHITVHSEPGKGSSFGVYFPRADEALQVSPADPARQALAPGEGTVLLVEDEAAVRELARDVLRKQGYTVLEAENGQHALQVLDDHGGPVDLLLTDVIMPGVTGRELAENILRLYPTVRVIYMSGYSYDVISKQELLEPGIHLLQKPFSVYDLVKKVQEVLG